MRAAHDAEDMAAESLFLALFRGVLPTISPLLTKK
jgi:hypothetical protein